MESGPYKRKEGSSKEIRVIMVVNTQYILSENNRTFHNMTQRHHNADHPEYEINAEAVGGRRCNH
jgi:hypothetical protein